MSYTHSTIQNKYYEWFRVCSTKNFIGLQIPQNSEKVAVDCARLVFINGEKDSEQDTAGVVVGSRARDIAFSFFDVIEIITFWHATETCLRWPDVLSERLARETMCSVQNHEKGTCIFTTLNWSFAVHLVSCLYYISFMYLSQIIIRLYPGYIIT